MRWYGENGRSLPWRGINDPYRIWLSEIILQQTRIEQGTSYYYRFIELFPTVNHLAEASEEDVLKAWQGLGYYSRARNLHATAQYISNELHGEFPSTYDDILKLKGIGRYTAAAIASFAYRLPYPVIDGNVYRLISRLYGISTPIGTDAAYREFETLLKHLIDLQRPDIFNQAIMDFGSTYCKPIGCDCEHCIFHEECVARREGRVAFLPVKNSAAVVRQRWFYYFDIEWIENNTEYTFIHRRESKDIWRGLYEFPLMECDHQLSREELTQKTENFLRHFSTVPAISILNGPQYTHKLTHRTIEATFIKAKLNSSTLLQETKERLIPRMELKSLPVSRLIDRYLSKQ